MGGGAEFVPTRASEIEVTPAGGITQTDTQAALEGLDTRISGIVTTSSNEINILDNGGVGDARLSLSARVTASSTTVTLNVAGPTEVYSFAPSDVGKTIVVRAAGPAGADLVTTIATYTSPTQVDMLAQSSATINGYAKVCWGTDNKNAMNACLAKYLAGQGTVIRIPFGKYLHTGYINLMNDGYAGLSILGTRSEASVCYDGYKRRDESCFYVIDRVNPFIKLAPSTPNWFGATNVKIEGLNFYYPTQLNIYTTTTGSVPDVFPETIYMEGCMGSSVSNCGWANGYVGIKLRHWANLCTFRDLDMGVFLYGVDAHDVWDFNIYDNITLSLQWEFYESAYSSLGLRTWIGNNRCLFRFGYNDAVQISNCKMYIGYTLVKNDTVFTTTPDGWGGFISGSAYGEISNLHGDSVVYGMVLGGTRETVGWRITNLTAGVSQAYLYFTTANTSIIKVMGGGIWGNRVYSGNDLSIKYDPAALFVAEVKGVYGVDDFKFSYGGAYQTGKIGINVLKPTQALHVNGIIRIGYNTLFPVYAGGELLYDSTTGTFQGYDGLNSGWTAFSNSGLSTLTVNSATPSVAGGKNFKTANTSATSITNFTGAIKGQEIKIIFTDANTTIVESATMKLNGTGNFVSTADDTMTLIYDGTAWYEITRSIN